MSRERWVYQGKTEYQKVMEKIRQDVGPLGCWLWTGMVDGNGYPQMSVKRKGKWTARAPYRIVAEHEFLNGERLGRDDHVYQRCHVKRCCRPEHLEMNKKRPPDKHHLLVAMKADGHSYVDCIAMMVLWGDVDQSDEAQAELS